MLGLGLALSIAKKTLGDAIDGLLSTLRGRATYYENGSASKSTIKAIDNADVLDKATILLTPTATSDALVHSVKTYTGDELVTNGTFDTDSDWILGTGWTISGGTLNAVGAGQYVVQKNIKPQNTDAVLKVQWTQTITSGTRLRFFARNYTDGGNETVLSGSATDGGVFAAGNCTGSGTYTIFVKIANGYSFKMLAESGNSATVDNVSVIDVSSDFDFDRASSATRINSSANIEDITSDLARINYDSNGENGHILLEPTSTNQITYSEDFSQWSKEATVTLTPNYGISPDGTQNSTRMQMNENDSIYVSASSGLTASFYVKGTLGETIRLSNGSATTHTLSGNWDRVETYDSSSASSLISINTYSGATARDVEIWGAQAEALPYATSYIPTLTGSTVTRATETLTGSGNSTLINSTEGVLYAEIAALADDGTSRSICLSDGSTTNRINILFNDTTNQIRGIVRSNNISIIDEEYTVTSTLDYHKVSVKYKENDFAIWIDGVERFTANSGSVPIGLNELSFNVGGTILPFYGKCKALAVFNEALSDTELTNLTS